MNLTIIGGGGWGTALAIVLSPKFRVIRMWLHEPDLADRMRVRRENDLFLPGVHIPENVGVGTSLEWALEGADIVLGAMPSQHARELYRSVKQILPERVTLASATKGIERGSLLRISEVIAEPTGRTAAVLSGPTFAREVARGEPAAVVIACTDLALAERIQKAFSGPTFRLYTNPDPIGVEVGAALKNVVAIAAGVCTGLGLGSNTLAALITRGLAEITRLAVAMGGQAKTLSGLAGLGDLVLTCGGDLSRNRKVGLELAAGRRLPEILASMKMVAEGVETCAAAVALGAKLGVDLPIIQEMHAVLGGIKTPLEALRELMDRPLKAE